MDGDGDADGQDWRALVHAATLLDMGRFVEAEQGFRSALAGDPESAPAVRGLGRALLGQGRLVDAERAARRAVDLDPEAPEGHHLVTDVYCEQDYGLAAVRSAERGLQVDPLSFVSHYQYGRALLLLPDRRRVAEQAARHAVGIDPHRADGHVLIGLCLAALDRVPEAEAAYREALAIDPHHPFAQNNLAVTSMSRGRLARSAGLLRGAASGAPQLSLIHDNLDTVLRGLRMRVVMILLAGLVTLGTAQTMAGLDRPLRTALGLLVLALAAVQVAVVARRLPRGLASASALLARGGWRALALLVAVVALALAVAYLALAPETRVEGFAVLLTGSTTILLPVVVGMAIGAASASGRR